MRYSAPLQTPGEPTFEGDNQFTGLDMETARWLLPAGHYSDGKNARCAAGALVNRHGTIKPHWANLVVFGAILGSGIYNNPNTDTKLMLVATATQVYRIASGGYPMEIGLPEGATLAGRVEFAQHFDKVLLHQSNGQPTYEWDGNLANTFELATEAHPEVTFTNLVPAAEWSVEFSGRSLFPIGRDRFGVSNYEDYASWDPTTKNFRANAGTADTLTALLPFKDGVLLIGKRSSIDLWRNFGADLIQLKAEPFSDSHGIFARKSWQTVGSENGIFLARTGIYRLSQVDETRLQASPVPVASQSENGRVIDPIAPLLRRINWAYAHLSVSGLDGPYYVLAAPIDGSTVNNCLFYYNTIADRWEGYDTFAAAGRMQIDNLLPFDYLGEQRLFAVNNAQGSIHVLNEGVEDELVDGRYEIDFDVRTRGYATLGWNATARRDFKRVLIPVATSRPSITVEEETEGARDNRVLTRTPVTKDRRQYDTFGKGFYDVTNAGDNFLEPGRQDYSVVLEEGDSILPGHNGIELDLKQESVLGGQGGFATKCRGRYIGYRIRCQQGEIEIRGVLVESAGSQREARRAA